MAFAKIDGVSKRFGPQRVLERTSLSLERGEIVSLLGASGSGKTTLLNMIAGFVEPDEGTIEVDGVELTSLSPNRRPVGMVFQNYALFPHLRVFENVAYGLRARGVRRREIGAQVETMIGRVGLSGMGARFPAQLSGGQQQRVALARVLVLAPRLLLLDEPFSALDAKLRRSMQVELVKLIRALDLTAIFVTHDQEEASAISDRIAVMRRGAIEQVDHPTLLYDAPLSAEVADFIGASNLVRAPVVDGAALVLGSKIPAPSAGAFALVLVRPENLLLAPARPEALGQAGTISFVRHLGPTNEYEVAVPSGQTLRALVMRSRQEPALRDGDAVSVSIADASACRTYGA